MAFNNQMTVGKKRYLWENEKLKKVLNFFS